MNKQLIYVIVSFFFFILTLVFNYLSVGGTFNGTDQAGLADKYRLPITPPGWAFSIWGLIYIWQFAWLCYMLYDTIKHREQLQKAQVLTFGYAFYVSWFVSCVCNSGWIVIFAYEEITASTFFIIGVAIALYVNAFISHKYIGLASQYQPSGKDATYIFPTYLLNPTSIALYRGLLLNGIGLYAAWLSIAQCLNIGLLIAYPLKGNQYTASIVALSVFAVIVVLYLFLDFYYLRSWLAYTYTPYAVLLWALSAIATNPMTGEHALKGATAVLVYILLGISAVATVAKIVFGILYVSDMKMSDQQQVNSEMDTTATTYNKMDDI